MNIDLKLPHVEPARTRRDFLFRAGGGFGALALAYLLQSEAGAKPQASGPLAPRRPPLPARAKRVIFLFMEGGPSHIDLFDPKPVLNRLSGQQLPESFGRIITSMGVDRAPLLGSRRTFRQHGQSGTWVSDWMPNVAECVDDMAVIRSCWCNALNHSAGVCQMNTGSTLAGRPSLGAWTTYGLGTQNQNLPAYVVMQDGTGNVLNGARNWGAGFMPAVYQGTRLYPGAEPIPNLNLPAGVTPDQDRARLDFLEQINRRHAESRPLQSELDARIATFELAYRMQSSAPEAVDLSRETAATQRLYGLDQTETAPFGRICLLARRLAERDVRFIQLYHGAGSKWDSHAALERNHAPLCRQVDKPIAGLLKDLKARGLLDDTLVIWGGEFGRTPMSERGDGRDHNPYGFTMWMAGGGVKGGQTIGATDELGLHAIQDRLHVHDLHATILHLLGLDHMGLVYRYNGRPERPTLNEGEAYTRIVG